MARITSLCLATGQTLLKPNLSITFCEDDKFAIFPFSALWKYTLTGWAMSFWGLCSRINFFITYHIYWYVSCPLLRLMYGEYWFCLSRLSMMVIGSFASYTKTKSVESAVWCLLTLDDDVETVAGSKYLNSVQGQNCSFSLFEQQLKTKLKWKWNNKWII
jgi:hypothetical protein